MTVAVLGLILLAAAGVLAAAVITSNTGAVEIDLWGTTISNVSLGVVFVAGMLTAAVGVAGIVLLAAGIRRAQRLRQERRVLRRENRRLTQRVDTGDTETDAAAYQADGQSTETPRRNFFHPRRSEVTDEHDDDSTEPRGGIWDRTVARDKSAASSEPTSRSS